MTTDREQTIAKVYRAFNARDIDGVLEHLAPDVDWPNAMTGTREHGRDAVRRYWTDQWQEIDPRVEPLEITTDAAGKVHVRVDQLVRSVDGDIISNKRLEHVYTFDGPFITRMDIIDADPHPEDDEDEDDGDDGGGE